jgi:hypothetical protein
VRDGCGTWDLGALGRRASRVGVGVGV